MQTGSILQYKNKGSTASLCLLIGLFCSVFLTAFLPSSIMSIICVVLLCFLFFTKEFYLAYPILMFFYNFLVLPIGGVSVYRIYTLLLFVKLFNNRFRLNTLQIFIFIIYTLYAFICIGPINIRKAIFSLYDTFILMVFAVNFFKVDSNKNVIKNFFAVFAISAIISYPYGLIVGNIMANNVYVRIMATFNDPNYMGFFFSIAIFCVLTQKLFSFKIRTIIIVLLEFCLLSTLSITAVLGNILFWTVYLIVTKQFSFKIVLTVFFVGIFLLILYFYSLEKEIGFFTDLAKRIEEKISQFLLGNIDGATTNRTALWRDHLQYYFNQSSFIKLLIGGNLINSAAFDETIFEFASHNEYIDWLLNIGIVGFCIMLTYVVYTLIKSYRTWKVSRSTSNLTFFMTKVIWAFYAMTLTLFFDERFFLFFFL